ncbi:unnamed protein product [Bursaphelenchus xylophilus]|uniref:phytanoyl-CoA dioxygenase n=1 Tax=Bursaphelenchus xylophilus TaxID=6326 RepID=A0A7I8WN18_BURXY|nr:unnamed protein product [Bursaphelenchus xylophilus]CAG9092567.1 unnamed protein product [Bursaphelenchus xylophilus]
MEMIIEDRERTEALKRDYSQPSRVLTRDQIEAYEKNGYIVVKGLISDFEVNDYIARFEEIVDGKNIHPEMTVMRNVAQKGQKRTVKTILKVQDFSADKRLFSYCQHPRIVEVVEDLIGPSKGKLSTINAMLLNKPSDDGSLSTRHPMHQDMYYFPFRPADFICCSWTALEPVNRENGCLVVIPGTHKLPLLPHTYPSWEGGVNKAFFGVHEFDQDKRVHVVMDKGDTVFFHPHLLHGSGANRTKGFRRAMSCHYANGDVCRFVDIRGGQQDLAASELLTIYEKKFKARGWKWPEWNIQQLWHYRSRPINNQPQASL